MTTHLLDPTTLEIAARVCEHNQFDCGYGSNRSRCADALRSLSPDNIGTSTELHHAYLRLRSLIPGAFDTVHAPTSQQVWDTTENALRLLLQRVEYAERTHGNKD